MPTLFTIGNSNCSLEDFLALLEAHGVRGIADVRAFPASRRWPHFGREALSSSLAVAGVKYDWLPELGGRRRPERAESPHTAWTVAAFRNYADYMETPDFRAGLDRLLGLADQRPTAFMCAEALYWQCHRRLIADQLLVHGHRVLHIQTPVRAAPPALPEFARVVGERIVYDRGAQGRLLGC